MNWTERRERFRAILSGNRCVHPGSVYDATSIRIAEAKARTAVEFRRPTKALEDAVAGGGVGLRVLTFGASVAEGGVPIVTDGKIVGGIGVSGAASQQDAQVAMAGAAAVA